MVDSMMMRRKRRLAAALHRMVAIGLAVATMGIATAAGAADDPVEDLAAALENAGRLQSGTMRIPADEHHAHLLRQGTDDTSGAACDSAANDAVTQLAAVMNPPAPEGPSPVQTVADDAGGTCIGCHGNPGFLMGAVKPPEAPPEDGCASAPSRPPFLGSFVNAAFTDTVHGRLGCVTCHGGDDASEDPAVAHANMKPGTESCAGCHADIVERHDTSLHHTLRGMEIAVRKRADDEDIPGRGEGATSRERRGEGNFAHLDIPWNADCASCHTECSDCHITLPKAVGGGLIKGHEFFRRAPMEETCGACHGSRAGGEYLGHFEGISPDVHFEAGMHCLDCHTNDLHGDGVEYENRWQVAGRPQCTDCHADLPNQTVMAHAEMHDDLSCQVCHSQPYQNCFNCHSGEEDGAYFRRAGSKALMLKIGRNTVDGYPHEIVPLRNNPIARDTFINFGEGLLPNFDDGPTWKTASPHNIQRITSQNRTCASCHDDPSVFLRESDLDPDGAAANRDVLLERE